jgi:hypothetical protein
MKLAKVLTSPYLWFSIVGAELLLHILMLFDA